MLVSKGRLGSRFPVSGKSSSFRAEHKARAHRAGATESPESGFEYFLGTRKFLFRDQSSLQNTFWIFAFADPSIDKRFFHPAQQQKAAWFRQKSGSATRPSWRAQWLVHCPCGNALVDTPAMAFRFTDFPSSEGEHFVPRCRRAAISACAHASCGEVPLRDDAHSQPRYRVINQAVNVLEVVKWLPSRVYVDASAATAGIMPSIQP